jgi:hypothetical protein
MQQHHAFVEPCWWLRGRSTSLYRCGIYRVNAMLEIRVSSSHEGRVYSEVVTDLERGANALIPATHGCWPRVASSRCGPESGETALQGASGWCSMPFLNRVDCASLWRRARLSLPVIRAGAGLRQLRHRHLSSGTSLPPSRRGAGRVRPGSLFIELWPPGRGTVINMSQSDALANLAARQTIGSEIALTVRWHRWSLELRGQVGRCEARHEGGARRVWADAMRYDVAVRFATLPAAAAQTLATLISTISGGVDGNESSLVSGRVESVQAS